MRKQIIILTTFLTLIINFSCGDDNNCSADEGHGETPALQDYVNGGLPYHKLEEFKIPDSINTSLIIAAYDEQLPQHGRTVIVYDDSTRVSVTKICYLIDSTVKTEPLIKIRNDEFKSKFVAENYRITTNNVYWSYMSGSLSTSYEYVRMF